MQRLKRLLSTTVDTSSQTQNTNPLDLPTGSTCLDTTLDYQLIKNPEYVGMYHVTVGFAISLEKKPFWLHRYMTKLLLGWKWEDFK